MSLSDNRIRIVSFLVGDRPFLRAADGATSSEMASFSHYLHHGLTMEQLRSPEFSPETTIIPIKIHLF